MFASSGGINSVLVLFSIELSWAFAELVVYIASDFDLFFYLFICIVSPSSFNGWVVNNTYYLLVSLVQVQVPVRCTSSIGTSSTKYKEYKEYK